MTDKERAYAPHCDQTILHAPGKCVYCDHFPEWQEYRKVAQIAFTGDDNELGVKRVFPDPQSPNAVEDFVPGIAPCPSTWFRASEGRDRWGGNRAYTQADIDEHERQRRAMEAQMASLISPPTDPATFMQMMRRAWRESWRRRG